MATTTNYGWAEPDNTSLVKNGAQDIRILGDAIDASVWNIGYGQAGKNKIINGDFGIWQRGTTISAGPAYTCDRWIMAQDTGSPSYSVSQQSFTVGAAPVAGYEGTYFARFAVTAASTATTFSFIQKIEDVRQFAGQTITVSLWAKSNASRTLTVAAKQNFGSGGSATVSTTVGTAAVTTSWARYSVSVAIPSISGKTLGAGSNLEIALSYPAAVMTNDFWGVQVEYGSKATPFQTASGGSPQAELAMCQRYYWRATTTENYIYFPGTGLAKSTTAAEITIPNPVTMRISPPTVEYSNVNVSDGVTLASGGAITLGGATPVASHIVVTYGSGLTQYRSYFMQGATGTSYLAFGAEL
jgi:hypothetical protein